MSSRAAHWWVDLRRVHAVVRRVFHGCPGVATKITNGVFTEISYTKQFGSVTHRFVIDPRSERTPRKLRKTLAYLKTSIDTDLGRLPPSPRMSWPRTVQFLGFILPYEIRRGVWEPASGELLIDRAKALTLRPGRIARAWIHTFLLLRLIGLLMQCSAALLRSIRGWWTRGPGT